MRLLKKKNYLAMIRNAAKGENRMFRNLYAEVDGKETDIAENGKWSCAILVSSILYLNRCIGDLHATVSGTLADMEKNRWRETKQLIPGVVLLWESLLGDDDGKPHDHLGFYLGDDLAMSNDSKGLGLPHIHSITYDGKRSIKKIYGHAIVNDEE